MEYQEVDSNNNNFQDAFENEYYDLQTVRKRSNKLISHSDTLSNATDMLDYRKNSFFEQNASTDTADSNLLTVPGLYHEEPNSPTFFKKRFCYKYVNNPKTNTCVGCKFKDTEGFHLAVHTESKWDYKKCTQLSQTDAFGKLNFPGSHTKTANYIRVQNETAQSDMIEFLYNHKEETSWGLTKPQLILSVTGGAQKFTLPYRMKKAFKRGLVKAAASTGAWIITGGTNTGVMRLVGEAVAEEFSGQDNKLTVLGIATWGKIALRNKMIQKQMPKILNYQHKLNMHDKNRDVSGKMHRSGSIKMHRQLSFSDKKKRLRRLVLRSIHNERQKLFRREAILYAPEEDSQTQDVFLDPNHTHFILVDDGSEGMFGKEIEFRADLEAELRRNKSIEYYEKKRCERKRKSSDKSLPTDVEDEQQNQMIPMILIVVQGGPNTLRTVEESLKKNVPVLVLADSKGCADLIANTCAFCSMDTCPDRKTLEKLIFESGMFDRLNSAEYDVKCKDAVQRLQYILSRMPENLINVFHLDSEEDGSDIELPILRAFLNTRKNQYYENLKLALQWNRSDIAKNYIFTGEEEFKPNQLANLMELALLQNKPEFVELLLENGLNLRTFVITRRLYFLYNSQVQTDVKRAPLFQRFKRKHRNAGRRSSHSHKSRIITFDYLNKLLKDYIFEDFEPSFLPNDAQNMKQMEQFLRLANRKACSDEVDFDFGYSEVDNPEQNLFIWALLLNRVQIATLFWQIGQHQICSALFASKLLKSMSTEIPDLTGDIIKVAHDFEEMAIGVLNIFDKSTDDIINGVILLRKIPFYNMDCLQMAVEGDCQKFVALSSVQNLLTDIWFGKVHYTPGVRGRIWFFLSCMTMGLLAPFCVFGHVEKQAGDGERETTLKSLAEQDDNQMSTLLQEYLENFELTDQKEAKLLPSCCTPSYSSDSEDSDFDGSVIDETTEQSIFQEVPDAGIWSRWSTFWDFYKRFVNSPRVHFVYDALFYVIFLILFSYMVLCELSYYKTEIGTIASNDSLVDNSTEKKRLIGKTVLKEPSFIEYFLIFWVFSFMMEEARQFFLGDCETQVNKNRFKRYFSNNWNYLDISGSLIFMIGMQLRLASYKLFNESLFVASRIVLCIDLVIWYMKLLHLSIVFKSLGPKLVMIQKMLTDLMFFMSIIAIFVGAFGVTTQATLFPGSALNLNLIMNILNKAYWPIYGEMKILDELSECLESDAGACENSGVVFSYIFLMIYMIIANVLLVNLLIAMFSSTFQDVQDNTDQIWKFQRYRLVFEYYDSPILPPPLNHIAYFVSFVNYLKKRLSCIVNRSRGKDLSKSKIVAKLISSSSDLNYKKNEIDLLLERERKFAEEFIRLEKLRNKESTESRLKINTEKLDNLEIKLNELIEGRYKEINSINNGINWIMAQYREQGSACGCCKTPKGPAVRKHLTVEGQFVEKRWSTVDDKNFK